MRKYHNHKPMSALQWAKRWTRNNVRALKFEEQGDVRWAELWRGHASICKDFIAVNLLLDHQITNLLNRRKNEIY